MLSLWNCGQDLLCCPHFHRLQDAQNSRFLPTNPAGEPIKKTKLSKEAREKAIHELKKLRQISPMSPEGTVVRNYLDWLLSIPWNKKSKINKDLVQAQQILDHDHYGIEKVKERIVEFLAVQQRANRLTGPILCESIA